MGLFAALRSLNADQRNAFVAAFLGWSLDAFDFFVLVFVLKDVAATFHTNKVVASSAIMLTLAMRPVGAFIFGWLADRFGRRIPLMIDIILYSVIELLSGFAPNLISFLVLRAIFGVAMGGEWGVGAALAMESIPEKARGVLSGTLQEGYPVGYLLAAVVFPFVAPVLGWRWMFFIGVLPALVSFFIIARVKESPAWEQARERQRERKEGAGRSILSHAPLFIYLVVLMTAFNFMSHGTQDMYPTFLQVQRHFSAKTVSWISVLANIGALAGGIFFGGLSQRIGRRKAIVIASLIAIPVIPLWTFAPSAALLALGSFLMQFMVQGAWGVIPAHLNELSPATLRGLFPGFAYQLGNLLASENATLQTWIAARHGQNFALALSSVIIVVLIAVVIITGLGREARGQPMDEAPA